MNPSFFVFLTLVCFITATGALPLCTSGETPTTLNTSLSFCGYNVSSCCNTTHDSSLRTRFQQMDISSPSCASFVKAILCAECDPFSAQIFNLDQQLRTVPLLCNSSNGFCEKIWDACRDVSIRNSPFATSGQSAAALLKSALSSKLADLWTSGLDFCSEFGGGSSNVSTCFNGEPVTSRNSSEGATPPPGLCVERIGNGSYIDMVAYPDGSNKVFLANQAGQIWLASVPDIGSGGVLMLNESDVFLDLTDQVYLDTQFGLMGIAVHPNFVNNGRFFASFNCDKTRSQSCTGRCSCNSAVRCDPAKLGSDYGAAPCQYYSIISEYNVSGSSTASSSVNRANARESRRIFAIGLPFTGHHGGQILFGPKDGYLYFMMGDGGSRGDPYNFAQNKQSLLGKIMRLDVDHTASEKRISDLDLWGNYSIPADNPFVNDSIWQQEIWALGLRNPWRCSFDSWRPSYFFCADIGQEVYEEVDLIVKGGNYGWRVYEGPSVYTPLQTPGGNTTPESINPIFPIMSYPHSLMKTKEGSASIIGGYMYRATTDPCMFGRYLYADLYGEAFWAGAETPENSGNFTSARISFRCAQDSPIPCNYGGGANLPSLGYIFSFGQDNHGDVYLLTSTGIYRIAHPRRCNYTCSKVAPSINRVPSTDASASCHLHFEVTRLLCSIFAILLHIIL